MAAPERHRYFIDGKAAVLAVGVGDSFGGTILDSGLVRELNAGPDTLSVSAKLDTTAKTLTIAAVGANPQINNDIGRYIVTVPAAQIDAAGELYVDVKNKKSGEEAKIVDRWQITVEDSAAD